MNHFLGIYKGIVVDGSDPKNMGRVKVRIKGIHDGLPNDNLPWAACSSKDATAQGGSAYEPAKNSKVSVRFLEGDINFPVWSGGVVESSADMPKNAKSGRYVLYESPEKRITIAINEELGDIEFKIDGFVTTLKEIITSLLSHTHMTPSGASGNAGTGVPPLLSADFNKGTLV